ncbi:hypothetical protein ABE82_26325 (plasmid) [Paenibacillus peoriae]|uniref:hypothetical protein n=1 Tax=Paenibacillus peoriae TaxID=59893 RepID=UPI000721FA4A|nr:hypothetical protein [Paenibacillus peoriae]ALS09934.1 hypothetical protein ABE82_26325 [Paenibacillus peoriae]
MIQIIGRFGGGPVKSTPNEVIFVVFIVILPFCILFTSGFAGVLAWYSVILSISAILMIRDRLRQRSTPFDKLMPKIEHLKALDFTIPTSDFPYKKYSIISVWKYPDQYDLIYTEKLFDESLGNSYKKITITNKNFQNLESIGNILVIKYINSNGQLVHIHFR